MSLHVEEEEEEVDESIDSLLREAGRIPSIPAAEPDRIGQQLGRFKIARTLGQGGMGIVYEAQDVELGRRVALKVLPSAAVADGGRRRRFLREGKAAAAVSHPNLAAVFDVGEADGTVFLAMELVAGATLRERIEGSPAGLRVADAVGIAIQIGRGLGKAHAAGIVHRDLKPENVMMDAQGNAKVVDFGLAKLLERTEPAGGDLSTQDGKILGTPSYMAPEQAKASSVTPAADVFSLGVVLYEMLTGTRPFVGTTLVDVLVAIARDTPPAPSRKAPDAGISRELDRIVLRCLAKEAGARYVDANTLADVLEAAPRASRSRAPLLAAALVVSGGVIAAAAFAVQRAPEPTRPVTLVLPPATSTSDELRLPPPSAASASASAPSVSARVLPRLTVTAHVSASTAPVAPRPSVDPLARQK